MQLKLYKSKAINQTENKYVISNMISIKNWSKIFRYRDNRHLCCLL